MLPSPNNSKHVQQITKEINLSISINISHMQAKRNLLLLLSSTTHVHFYVTDAEKKKVMKCLHPGLSDTKHPYSGETAHF
jgi:hypothetical protein